MVICAPVISKLTLEYPPKFDSEYVCFVHKPNFCHIRQQRASVSVDKKVYTVRVPISIQTWRKQLILAFKYFGLFFFFPMQISFNSDFLLFIFHIIPH